MLLAGQQSITIYSLFDEKFVLSNWNEIELDRNDAYTEQQFGRNGLNGGLTIAWKVSILAGKQV